MGLKQFQQSRELKKSHVAVNLSSAKGMEGRGSAGPEEGP